MGDTKRRANSDFPVSWVSEVNRVTKGSLTRCFVHLRLICQTALDLPDDLHQPCQDVVRVLIEPSVGHPKHGVFDHLLLDRPHGVSNRPPEDAATLLALFDPPIVEDHPDQPDLGLEAG